MHEWTAVAGVILTVCAMGCAGVMVINAVARNLLRIKAASAPPLSAAQEQRMAQMETEIATLKDEVSRLSAVESFYAQLQAPAAAPRPAGPPGGT